MSSLNSFSAGLPFQDLPRINSTKKDGRNYGEAQKANLSMGKGRVGQNFRNFRPPWP